MVNVSREVIKTLEKYQQLVLKWNKAINLVANNTIKEFWLRHIMDSLQLLSFMDNKNVHLVDIGSGAGFPGIVLSIAGVKRTTIVESDSRKAVFLLQAAALSSNKIEIINKRIENISIECDILTSRACANLTTLFDYTKTSKVKDKYLFLKGENYQQELDQAAKYWLFDCKIYESTTHQKGKILAISNLKKKYHESKDNFSS